MIRFTILGQPCSKANSRKFVTIGGRPSLIKSEDALAYERDALRQIPPAARKMVQGPVRIFIKVYYASERPDLDESLILDILQCRYKTTKLADGTKRRDMVQVGVYVNDRQVREKHIYHAIDKANPRAEIIVESIDPQGSLHVESAPEEDEEAA